MKQNHTTICFSRRNIRKEALPTDMIITRPGPMPLAYTPIPQSTYHWERRSVWDLDEKDLLIPDEQRRRKVTPGISILPRTSIDADTLDMLKNDENPEYKALRPFSQDPPVSWDLTRTPRPEQSYRTLLAEISRSTNKQDVTQSQNFEKYGY